MSLFDDVGEFHKKMGLPTVHPYLKDNEPPHLLDQEVGLEASRAMAFYFNEKLHSVLNIGDALDGLFTYRTKFMLEELLEFADAQYRADLPAAADALVDLVYVALGTAHLMGLPFDELWRTVQLANLQKERATGADDPRSKRGHHLDVVKPVGWQAPDHVPVLLAHGWKP